jgi:predicted anti-sigma-YlaC factor YlaD
MSTSQTTHQHVFQLLQEATQSDELAPPSVAVIAHIATCAECRGMLIVAAAALAGAGQAPASIGCADCQDQLAAYIDRELEAGTKAAIQDYPQVWWHLWLCPTCAEIYQLTTALAEATQAGILPPLPSEYAAPAPRPRSRNLRIQRIFLNYALPAHTPALGAIRGSRQQDTVLFADDEGSNPLTLSVQRQPDDNWRVSVRTATPLAAWLVLTLGDRSFRAYFNSQGEAIVDDVPDALLGAASGPDLVIGIEFDTADPSGD